VIKATVLRTDPPLLAAADVRAYGNSGLLPFIDEKVLKERELERQRKAQEEAQEAKKAQEEQERQQREAGGRGQGLEGGVGRGRGGPGEGEGMNTMFDPDHPTRRAVAGMSEPPGAKVTGDERVERAFWAIVVAKVPIREQLKRYRDAFENTRSGFDPQYDFPRYAGYAIQRAEVKPGQELQWENVKVYDGQGKVVGGAMGRAALERLYQVISTEWATQMPEVVDERWLDPEQLLVYPLPPLLGRDWGKEATHPDIPLAINAPPPSVEIDPSLDETPKTPADTDDEGSMFGGGDRSASPLARPGGGIGGMGRGMGRGEVGGPGRRYGGERSFRGEGGPGRSFAGRRGEFGGAMGRGMSPGATLPKEVDNWLLRFFDFSVEPGKKYKYRVRLVLEDPNQGEHVVATTLDGKVLDRLRESAKGRKDNRPLSFRYADWSEPSPTVGIPLSGSVRLAEAKVKNEKLFNDEPSATLLVQSFDVDEKGNAIQGAKKKELRRGFVANSIEETEYMGPGNEWIDTDESFKFLTGITVVDVRGGERLTKEVQAPSRVLLLDPAGELYIRDELDDENEVKLHDALFAKPDPRREGEYGVFGPGRGVGGPRGER
jgi:hypothetical protein